jgi:hypothetical protein
MKIGVGVPPTDLLPVLANCPKAQSTNIHNRFRAVYEGCSRDWL